MANLAIITFKKTFFIKHMSVLPYVHLKNDLFSISLSFPLYQGNTLSLPNVVTFLFDFLTAYKRFWHLCSLAEASD